MLPDIVEASCLITLLFPIPPFTLWSRPVRKLETVSIGLTFSFSSIRFLGRLIAGCRLLLTASLLSSSALLAATLKITFMLCVEQLPPTLRCRSRLKMIRGQQVTKVMEEKNKFPPARGGYEVVVLARSELETSRCWTETPAKKWLQCRQLGNMIRRC